LAHLNPDNWDLKLCCADADMVVVDEQRLEAVLLSKDSFQV
jgi:hypothetical protein